MGRDVMRNEKQSQSSLLKYAGIGILLTFSVMTGWVIQQYASSPQGDLRAQRAVEFQDCEALHCDRSYILSHDVPGDQKQTASQEAGN